jgi:hypothetical protein
MGKKADADHTTPESRAKLKEMVGGYTAEERAKLKEMLARSAPGPDEAVALAKARKAIHFHLAIRDGLIPPPWAEELLKAVKPKPEMSREGWQERRVKAIACELWPPDGKHPPDLGKPEIIKKIGDAYENKYKGKVGRNTILRSQGLLRRR